jgi:hypothetical protein
VVDNRRYAGVLIATVEQKVEDIWKAFCYPRIRLAAIRHSALEYVASHGKHQTHELVPAEADVDRLERERKTLLDR